MKKLWLLCAFSIGVCGAWDNYNQAYQAGCQAWKARNYAKVIDIQQEAAKLTQKPQLIYNAKIKASYAAYRLRKYDVSAQMALEILELKGLSPQAQALTYLQLGSTYLRQRKFDQAEKAYTKCLDLKPTGWTYHSALLDIAGIYNRQKKYQLAEDCIKKVMDSPTATASNKYYAQYHLFNFRLYRKNFAGAEECLKNIELLLKEPKAPKVAAASLQNLHGMLLFRQNKFAPAATYFNKSYQTKNCPPWLARESKSYEAFCYNRLGQYQKAKDMLDQIKNPLPWVKRTILRDIAKKTK